MKTINPLTGRRSKKTLSQVIEQGRREKIVSLVAHPERLEKNIVSCSFSPDLSLSSFVDDLENVISCGGFYDLARATAGLSVLSYLSKRFGDE